jgi:hypothetical protein
MNMSIWRRFNLVVGVIFVLLSVALIGRGLYFGGYIVTVPNTAVWSEGEGNYTVELEAGETYATWGTTDPYAHWTVWSESGVMLDDGPAECDSDCEVLGDYSERGGFVAEERVIIEVTKGEVAILHQEDAWNLPSSNSNAFPDLAFYAYSICGVLLLIPSIKMLFGEIRKWKDSDEPAVLDQNPSPYSETEFPRN